MAGVMSVIRDSKITDELSAIHHFKDVEANAKVAELAFPGLAAMTRVCHGLKV